MKLTDLIEVGLEVLTEVEQVEGLKDVGDKATLPPLRVRIKGRKIKLTLEAEVEG